MKVTRKSMLTGKTHTREVAVTQDQIDAWQRGKLIQIAMPNLSDDDREFILTGSTPEEWDAAFPEDDEDEYENDDEAAF